MLGKEAKRVRNRKTSRDHSNYSFAEVRQNTEASPGDLRRLTVTQTVLKRPETNSYFITKKK